MRLLLPDAALSFVIFSLYSNLVASHRTDFRLPLDYVNGAYYLAWAGTEYPGRACTRDTSGVGHRGQATQTKALSDLNHFNPRRKECRSAF